MRDIRIYDFEFNLLMVMCDVISSQWRLHYRGIGTFEGHFRLDDKITDVILSNKYIVVVQGNLQAVCTGKIVSDELVVCGRTVNWILTKRVRPPFKTSKIFEGQYTDPETILLYCLRLGLTEPPLVDDLGYEINGTIDENKKIENFILPQAIGAEKLQNHFWRNSANNLATLTEDLCKKLNRGYRVIFDIKNKCWRFEFLYPKENNILISDEAKTAYEVSYSEDLLNHAEAGWYSDIKSESENTESEDLWHYIKNTDKKGIYLWDDVLSGVGKSEAEDELLKKKTTENIEAKLRDLKYGTDYEIGDVVSVYVRFGTFKRLSKYFVSGVNISMSVNESFEEPVLTLFEE